MVRDFIIDNVEKYPRTIALVLVEKFGFSRQRAHQYLVREVENGTIIKTGRTRWSQYFLSGGSYISFTEKIEAELEEYQVWSKYVKPMVKKYSDNVYQICTYGFTEIINNCIDHSEGSAVFVDVEIRDNEIAFRIIDNGIGIFKKIQRALKLESPRESILHLSKGKFTTDPSKHSGQGIFFTSRMFDSFSISSSDMYYTFRNEDWMLSSEKSEDFGKGTQIKMVISLDSKKVPKEIMDQYADKEIGFSKTIVAVALSADPNDPHVSRSQAKRLLMGLEKFTTIVLDFKGVTSVGQAFVDEVFRVFKIEHPDIEIHYVNADAEAKAMIERGLATK